MIYQKSSTIFAITRVITLEHNNEELRNTNGCYLVTQFSSNPNNRLILRQLQILRFFQKKGDVASLEAKEVIEGYANRLTRDMVNAIQDNNDW